MNMPLEMMSSDAHGTFFHTLRKFLFLSPIFAFTFGIEIPTLDNNIASAMLWQKTQSFVKNLPKNFTSFSENFTSSQTIKLGILALITWLSEICLTTLIALFWNFLLMICNLPLLFSHSKNIRMSTLITIIITYYLLIIIIIITKSHNNYCSVGVMELCLLNLLILIDCFLCNSYPCVLFESLSHVINQESNIYSGNLAKFIGKFIPNFPLKHVITSTNLMI